MTSIFVDGNPYRFYASATNEKSFLEQKVISQYYAGSLPIKLGDKNKRVLDLGSGTGANTWWLREVFPDHTIIALEPSIGQIDQVDFLDYKIYNSSFEEFDQKNFEFILCSHVLQYINTNPKKFIQKIYDSLVPGGEAWIIQQTQYGLNEIIQQVKPHLKNNLFDDWLLFNDYALLVDNLKLPYETDIMHTSIQGIDYKNPTNAQKKILKFILGGIPYKNLPSEARDALGKLPIQKRIYHPNGIIKIKRPENDSRIISNNI